MKLNTLTGLRGIAAYSVLLAHAMSCSCHFGSKTPLQPFEGRLAYFGMALFFVLSGFVIQYNYSKLFKEEGLLYGGYKFFVARFARLYPLYAMVMIFTLDRIPSRIFHNKQLAEIAYATLTQSWFDMQNIFFAPSWSISTECFFYLFFLISFKLFDKITKPTMTLMMLTIFLFLFLPNLLHWELTTIFKHERSMWVTYFSPLSRIFDFIAGMLAAKIYMSADQSKREINWSVKISSCFCIIWVLIVLCIDPLQNTKYGILISNFMYTPALAPFLYMCCKYDLKINKLLCNQYILMMGELSYSVYLLGFLIMASLGSNYEWNYICPMAYINAGIKIISIISLTTLIAYGSYYLIEVPSRKYIKKALLFEKRRINLPLNNVLVIETNK